MTKFFTIRRLIAGTFLAIAGLMFQRYRNDEYTKMRNDPGRR